MSTQHPSPPPVDAIAPTLTPSRSDAFKTPPERPQTCFACGGYHGGVNAKIGCLRDHLHAARRRIDELHADLLYAAVQIGNLKSGGAR